MRSSDWSSDVCSSVLLYAIGVSSSLVEEVIVELIQQDFINEERFARAWAGGKFRLKGWGRIKIKRGLQLKRVSDYCIRAGLSEIDEAEYRERLRSLLDAKLRGSPKVNTFLQLKKAADYAITRGLALKPVWELVRTKK